jgi:uncharacterized protein (TIGR02246 family)
MAASQRNWRFHVSFLVPAISKSTSVLAIAFLTAASPLTRAIEPNESVDRAAIEAFTRKFLRAFEDLDMQQFIACFADNATMFFPMPEPPERAQGKQAIKQLFEHVFASIRSTAKSGPPFHHLAPEDLVIQMMPGQSAVVSFHLRNSKRIARRTLVLTNTNGRWLILHLHASNVPIEAKSDRYKVAAPKGNDWTVFVR